jgi:hypothetical protein
MSEKVTLQKQPISDGGPLAFLQLTPEDIQRMGDGYIDLAARIVHDFIIKRGGDDVVWDAQFLLTGGLNFDIYKPVVVWRGTDGKHFEDFDLAPTSFTVPTPDATDPRIDRVYAHWEEDALGIIETRHVKVLPTDADSQEADISASVTKRNKLTITYIQGTPSSNPIPPDLPSDSVELWQVFVPANAVALATSHFRDERHKFLSLEEVNEELDAILKIINVLKGSQPPFRADQITIDQGQIDESVQNKWPTAQDAFNDLSRRKGGGGGGGGGGSNTSRARPEILRPDKLPSDSQSGLMGAIGDVDSGTPIVEYPHPRQVDFNGTVRDLSPGNYADPSLNARVVNKSITGGADSVALSTPLSLANVVVEETNGGGQYLLQSAVAPVYATHGNVGNRRICPRSSTIIDLVGVGNYGAEANSNWYEFDVVAGTFTQRMMTGDLPTYGVSFAVSLGNGKILMAGPGGTAVVADKGRIKWFLLDAVTGVSTAIANGPGDVPTTALGDFNIMGDLIIGGANGIVSLIVWGEGINTQLNVGQFEYHIDSNTFSALTPLGGGPSWARQSPPFQHMDCCVLRQGDLILVDGLGNPAHTFIFSHASHSWKELNIAEPFSQVNPFAQGYLWGLTLSNVNGHIHMLSGSSTLWELTVGATAVWKQLRVPAMEDADGNTRWGALMTGLLITDPNAPSETGLAMGNGFVIGGGFVTGPTSLAVGITNQVWKFSAGGAIASNCLGTAGVTLGDGATSATIRLPDTTGGLLPWAVGKYIITVLGLWGPGQVKAVVSFDQDAHTLEVPIGQNTTIIYSGNTPIRLLRLILTGTPTNKPCVQRVDEVFESQGGPGLTELVVRFNPPIGTKYLYCDRDTGQITLEDVAQKTTAGKCYLLKVVRSGGSAPSVLNIVNKPFIHRVYRIPDASPVIENDFCVDPAFISAKKIDGSGFYKDVANPAAPFNGNIDTSALTGSGETAVLELEA